MCDHSMWPLYVSSMCEHSMCDHSMWAACVSTLCVSTPCVSTLCVTTCERSNCEHDVWALYVWALYVWALYVWALYVWALYVWPLYVSSMCEHYVWSPWGSTLCVSTPCVTTLCEQHVWAPWVSTLCVSSMCEHSMCEHPVYEHHVCALYVWAACVSTLVWAPCVRAPCVCTLCVSTLCVILKMPTFETKGFKDCKNLKDFSSTSDLSFVSLWFCKVLQLMSGLKGDMDATARGASVVSSLGVTADHTDLEASKRPNHSKPFEMMICLQFISAKLTCCKLVRLCWYPFWKSWERTWPEVTICQQTIPAAFGLSRNICKIR